jgi:hypothetical protein
MALDLIAPEIPSAQQNKGAELFMSSLGQGLAGVAKFAQMRRQSEDEILQLATQERIAQDQHAFEREKLHKDTEVQDAMTRAHTDYYKSLGDAAIIKANAYAGNTKNVVAFNQQKQDLIDDVNSQANKLKLNDPEFATKEPVQYAANVMQFKDMFDLSPIPEVKNAIKQFQTIADQQKIPLRTGMKNKDGVIVPTGEPKMVPIWQIVQKSQDPLYQDQIMNDLHASGHTEILNRVQKIAGKDVPETVIQPDATIRSYMDKGKGVQFQRAQSRVPPAMLKRSDARGTSPTDMPELPTDSSPPDPPIPDSSSTFSPTQTDTYLAHAKAAIAAGAPLPEVAKRLQDMSIDPAQLWQS